jgi:hypothetical protein
MVLRSHVKQFKKCNFTWGRKGAGVGIHNVYLVIGQLNGTLQKK